MRTDDPEFWNLMFSQEEYAFGEKPNSYLKEKLKTTVPGKILLPAEGEGRNAVYCATNGWEVSAFDLSYKGKEKAEALAHKHKVDIDFQVGDLSEMTYPKSSFDALGLIFAHFMPNQRRAYHRQLSQYVKSGGILILEGHARAGDTVDMRFDLSALKTDFEGFKFFEGETKLVELHEGQMIKGKTRVVRLFGQKL